MQVVSASSSFDTLIFVRIATKREGRVHLEQFPGDADLAARIASSELAGQMQLSVPEMMDLSSEPESVHRQYGTGSGSDPIE